MLQQEGSGYTILLARQEERDPMALARALAAVRHTPVQDQVIAARGSWGIVAEELPQEEASALAKDLDSSGLDCLVCRDSSLVELPPAEQATDVDGIPRESPTLIAVAGMTITSTTTKMVTEGPSQAQKAVNTAIMMSTGLPIKIGGRNRKVEKAEKQQNLVFYVDLLYESPPRHVRVHASQFDYSFLKERKLYQALGNCRLLVKDLVGAAPQAWQNRGTRILLEGKPINTMGYTSLDDLEREERWLLTLRALEG